MWTVMSVPTTLVSASPMYNNLGVMAWQTFVTLQTALMSKTAKKGTINLNTIAEYIEVLVECRLLKHDPIPTFIL